MNENNKPVQVLGDPNAPGPNDNGLRFESENVAKQPGGHASDRKVIGQGRIAIVTNLSRFAETFGEAAVLGILDGTSVRVMSQDVSRRLIGKGVKDAPTIDAAILNRLRGVRNSSARGETKTITVTVEKRVYSTPSGTYDGTDETELQAQWIADLTAAGMTFEAAKAIATQQHLA